MMRKTLLFPVHMISTFCKSRSIQSSAAEAAPLSGGGPPWPRWWWCHFKAPMLLLHHISLTFSAMMPKHCSFFPVHMTPPLQKQEHRNPVRQQLLCFRWWSQSPKCACRACGTTSTCWIGETPPRLAHVLWRSTVNMRHWSRRSRGAKHSAGPAPLDESGPHDTQACTADSGLG